MRPINRLYTYIESKGIKPTRLEKDIGLSNGYLGTAKKRGSDLGTGVLEKIVDYCSDLNLNWLLTGRGYMLLSTLESKSESHLDEDKTKNDKNVTNQIGNKKGNEKGNNQNLKEMLPLETCPSCAAKEERLAYQGELIISQQKTIDTLERMVSHLEHSLDKAEKGAGEGNKDHPSSKAS